MIQVCTSSRIIEISYFSIELKLDGRFPTKLEVEAKKEQDHQAAASLEDVHTQLGALLKNLNQNMENLVQPEDLLTIPDITEDLNVHIMSLQLSQQEFEEKEKILAKDAEALREEGRRQEREKRLLTDDWNLALQKEDALLAMDPPNFRKQSEMPTRSVAKNIHAVGSQFRPMQENDLIHRAVDTELLATDQAVNKLRYLRYEVNKRVKYLESGGLEAPVDPRVEHKKFEEFDDVHYTADHLDVVHRSLTATARGIQDSLSLTIHNLQRVFPEEIQPLEKVPSFPIIDNLSSSKEDPKLAFKASYEAKTSSPPNSKDISNEVSKTIEMMAENVASKVIQSAVSQNVKTDVTSKVSLKSENEKSLIITELNKMDKILGPDIMPKNQIEEEKSKLHFGGKFSSNNYSPAPWRIFEGDMKRKQEIEEIKRRRDLPQPSAPPLLSSEPTKSPIFEYHSRNMVLSPAPSSTGLFPTSHPSYNIKTTTEGLAAKYLRREMYKENVPASPPQGS